MKILHIIDSLGIGGAQGVVKGILEKQASQDDVFLYVLRRRSIEVVVDHENVSIFRSVKKYSLGPLFELKAVIEEKNIGVLHCHLFRSQFFGWFLKRFFFPDVKLILHEHGQIFQGDWYYRRFMRIAKNRTDLFLAVSEAIMKALVKNSKIPADKIHLIYNFVDLKKYDNSTVTWNINREKQKIGLSENVFVVGFAGRLIERKGWKDLMAAADILKLRDIVFIVAGEGKDKKAMLNMIKERGLKNIVLYLGHFTDMVFFYSLLDCFVVPSHWEGLAMVQLEVMAMGIPFITSNGPGLTEIPREKMDALYCKIKNPEDLSRGIEKLYESRSLRETLATNSQERVREYSLDNYLINLSKVYKSVCQDSV